MKNKFAVKLIESYQNGKPANSVPKCRYYPSCSEYGKRCYQKFNFFKASYLTLLRLLRCNPLFKGGYDPIPLSIKEKKRFRFEHKCDFVKLNKIK